MCFAVRICFISRTWEVFWKTSMSWLQKFQGRSVYSAHACLLRFHLKGELVDSLAFKITFVYKHTLTGIRNLVLSSGMFAGQRQLDTLVLVLLESPDKTKAGHTQPGKLLPCGRGNILMLLWKGHHWAARMICQTEPSTGFWDLIFCFVGKCSYHSCFSKQVNWLI